MKKLYLSVVILSLISLSFAEDNSQDEIGSEKKEQWKVISKKDGFTMYSKISKNSPIRAMRAHGIVNARVEKIIAILRNVSESTDWVPNLKERKYVKNISDTEAILYDVTDMPWPVDDRDTIVHHKLTLDKERNSLVLYFKSVENDKIPKHEDKVRAKIHFGKIYFTPKGENTLVELVLLVDPMGSIPKWAVNVLQVSMPYDFLMSLNKYAAHSTISCPEGVKELISQLD